MNATMPTLVGLCLVLFFVALLQIPAEPATLDDVAALAPVECATAAGLEEEGQFVQERMNQRSQLVQQLLDGQISLLAVAQWFRFYETTTLESNRQYVDSLPGETRDEKLCHQVLLWADAAMRNRTPSEVEGIRQRLWAELESARCRAGGKIVLPD